MERTCEVGRGSMTDEERFWAKVDKHGPVPEHRPELGPCWIWTGSTYSNGYGYFWIPEGKKSIGAHRYALILSRGEISHKALHKCDVRRCVRNDGENGHLFEGTLKDNTRDMLDKGRHGAATHPERVARGDRSASRLHPGIRAGELNGRAKLTWELVRSIRSQYAKGGISRKKMAVKFGVSKSLIDQILSYQIWKEIAA